VNQLLIALPVLLFSMVAHEYAHGYAALKQGDPTAKAKGRLTMNPLRHIDPFFTVAMPLLVLLASGGRVVFGGAKPVPVDPRNYRQYRRGDVIVSSAGIVANLGLAVVSLVLGVVVGALGAAAPAAASVLAVIQLMCWWGVWLNLLLAFFNLIPIPPLDGSHLLFHALPRSWAMRYRTVARHGVWVLLLAVLIAPEVLYGLLAPAFALHGVACDLAGPYTLQPFPLCHL
jgi:Zn-dependent protease